MPLAEECLLVPFYVAGKAVGTIWAIMHSGRRKFDAEDERLMNALGQFASLAYQTLDTIDELKLQIAARQKAEAEMRELASGLQVKMRRFVDANIMGIFIWTLDGQIVEANDTFLRMVDYDRAALVAGLLRWTDLTPAEWRAADDQRVVELKATGGAQPYEKEFLRKGGDRVPVLVGGALFEAGGSEGVAFVVDLTDRKRAEAEAREAQLELAHANRLAAIGQLSASIGHEINQPLSGVVTNAETGLLWLTTERPNVREAIGSFSRVVRDGKRASEVVNRVRALIKKAPPRRDSVEINEAIQEVIALTHSEAVKNGVSVRTELAETVPLVEGDRVQLQQVMLNLIMNAVEAMIGPGGGPRELLIGTALAPDGVRVAVQDSGPGLSPEDSRARVRGVLHDQDRRFGHGPVDLPLYRRSAWGAIVGKRVRAPGRDIQFYIAGAPALTWRPTGTDAKLCGAGQHRRLSSHAPPAFSENTRCGAPRGCAAIMTLAQRPGSAPCSADHPIFRTGAYSERR